VDQPPQFALTVQPDRDRVRVVATGEIDLVTAPVLEAQLKDLWAAGWTDVTADLSGVTFLDSTGVHVLVTARSNAMEQGAAFSVMNGNRAVSEVLRICGVEDLLAPTPRLVE
jgi:anti-sigma B factor antagonist